MGNSLAWLSAVIAIGLAVSAYFALRPVAGRLRLWLRRRRESAILGVRTQRIDYLEMRKRVLSRQLANASYPDQVREGAGRDLISVRSELDLLVSASPTTAVAILSPIVSNRSRELRLLNRTLSSTRARIRKLQYRDYAARMRYNRLVFDEGCPDCVKIPLDANLDALRNAIAAERKLERPIEERIAVLESPTQGFDWYALFSPGSEGARSSGDCRTKVCTA